MRECPLRYTQALMHIATGTCPSQIHNLGILVTVAMGDYVSLTIYDHQSLIIIYDHPSLRIVVDHNSHRIILMRFNITMNSIKLCLLLCLLMMDN